MKPSLLIPLFFSKRAASLVDLALKVPRPTTLEEAWQYGYAAGLAHVIQHPELGCTHLDMLPTNPPYSEHTPQMLMKIGTLLKEHPGSVNTPLLVSLMWYGSV